jgi:hypothetical protein
VAALPKGQLTARLIPAILRHSLGARTCRTAYAILCPAAIGQVSERRLILALWRRTMAFHFHQRIGALGFQFAIPGKSYTRLSTGTFDFRPIVPYLFPLWTWNIL